MSNQKKKITFLEYCRILKTRTKSTKQLTDEGLLPPPTETEIYVTTYPSMLDIEQVIEIEY